MFRIDEYGGKNRRCEALKSRFKSTSVIPASRISPGSLNGEAISILPPSSKRASSISPMSPRGISNSIILPVERPAPKSSLILMSSKRLLRDKSSRDASQLRTRGGGRRPARRPGSHASSEVPSIPSGAADRAELCVISPSTSLVNWSDKTGGGIIPVCQQRRTTTMPCISANWWDQYFLSHSRAALKFR